MKNKHYCLFLDDRTNGLGKSDKAIASTVAPDLMAAFLGGLCDAAIDMTLFLYASRAIPMGPAVRSCGFSIHCKEDGSTTRFSAFTDKTACLFGVVVPHTDR